VLSPPAATPGSGKVSLSWAPSVGAASYTVKRATVSGGPYVTVACRTTTTCVDSTVSSGTTYYYVVSAAHTGRNAGGASADSVEASATPGPAAALAAAAGDLEIGSTGGSCAL
jgi:cellulose 1,4-beta-cellobiosidase